MFLESLRNFATSVRIYQRNIQGRKFEPEAPYMSQIVKKGDICLHFGGSDGRHSYLLSGFVGETGLIHVYEPSNYSYAIMSRLIRWHGLKNVIPHNAAIGAANMAGGLARHRQKHAALGRADGRVVRDHVLQPVPADETAHDGV